MPDDPTRPDYARLIDAATWAFIRRTEAFAAPAGADLAAQRAAYDAMARAFHAGRPPGVATRDAASGGVPVRAYGAASGTTVLYFHGGGFVVGGLESHDDICAELCARTGLAVVCPDYRLAPEHPHPAAVDDGLAVARALAGPLVLAGDSAGGSLAAAVAHALRGDARLRGQVLVYPGLGGDPGRGSAVVHARAPLLTAGDVAVYARLRHAGPVPGDDPSAHPLHDARFDGLPPTVIFSAECDPLADDGRDYAARIRAAGGQADWHLERGLVHGYLRARHTVPRARDAFARIADAVRRLAQAP